MSTLKSFFSARIGKSLSWAFQPPGGQRFGVPSRRDYSAKVVGLDGDTLVCAVTSVDFDAQGRKTSRVPGDHGVVRVPLKELSQPVEALEEAARLSDPQIFVNSPRAQKAEAAAEDIEARVRAVSVGQGESPPRPESVARFRKFWAENPGLALPELFSSKDGTLRARWQDGHDRTLWINFPPDGPLGWSAGVPRQGGYGLRRINARCNDDQDVVWFAEAAGVRCRAG